MLWQTLLELSELDSFKHSLDFCACLKSGRLIKAWLKEIKVA